MEALLGKLLKFVGRKNSASTGRAGRHVSGDAQILIFTGVRYERGTPPPPNNHSDARRKRKRV
jgi:hypothetical protein